MEIFLSDESATLALGAHLAEACPAGFTIYLHGELGAGKTTFVRGLLQALGHQGKVKSPTYTIVEPYELQNGRRVYHFDLYRVRSPDELVEIGHADFFGGKGICFIEWADRAERLVPAGAVQVHCTTLGPTRRRIEIARKAKETP